MAVSKEKLEKAHLLWATMQESMSPLQWEGFLNQYGDPLVPLPPEESKIDAFFLQFSDIYLGKKTPDEIAKTIDGKMLRSFVDEYERESEKNEQVREQSTKRAKDRAQDIMRHALEEPVAPSQKGLFVRVLQAKNQSEPDKPVAALVSEAIDVGEAAQPFLNPDVAKETQGPLFFTQIKTLSPVQRAITAPLLDAITTVFPGLRQGTMNKDFEDAFRNLVNVPDKLIGLFGAEVVQSRLFQQMLDNAKKALPTGSAPGGAKTVIDDIAASLFRHAPESALIAYWELYRMNIAQGLQAPSLATFQSASMGLGSNLFHLVAGEAKGFAIRKGLTALGGKALVGGVFGGPAGWAAAAFSLASGLFGKATNWMKGLGGAKPGAVPGDNWIIAALGLVLLVMIGLPIFTQIHLTNTSLATRLNMGGGEGSGVMGPVEYAGPAAAGDLQCLNYDVSPKQFGDVSGQPFSDAQGATVNSAVLAFPQLGLYNCLLNCPSNQINLYSGGPNTWWGWAPSSSPGDLIIYDGFFNASGGQHAQARLIAHELAHELAYTDPSLISKFDNEGYCGKLCTYPSGTRGACSDLETIDETFAESAAMYLVGEDLQSLCPKGYDFMTALFSRCAK